MKLSRPTLDVQLVTNDLARSWRFYAEMLDLQVVPALADEDPSEVVRFKIGGHVLEFIQCVDAEPDAGGVGDACGMRLLAFILDDLDEVLARFDTVGLSYHRLPLPERLPFRVAFASDPDGNALELVGLRRPAGDAFAERLQLGLTVADIARTKHFYTELLGFAQQPEMPLPSSMGVAGNMRHSVTAGATTVKFWKIGDGLQNGGGAPEDRTGIRLMRARVPDLDATYAELVARGIEIRRSPSAQRRSVVVADPDDNWIELSEAE